MKKIIEIEGMSCEHCAAIVGKALNSIEGVKAKVSLKKKQATIKAPKDIEDKIIEEVVTNAGYKVINTKEQVKL